MPIYRTLDLSSKKVKYVIANNKAQARSHIAQQTVQVEIATPAQMATDVLAALDIQPEKVGAE